MYINNILHQFEQKQEENKCGRIFRPWDNERDNKDNSQDSTITTTTQEDDEEDEEEVKCEIVQEKSKENVNKSKIDKDKIEKKSNPKKMVKERAAESDYHESFNIVSITTPTLLIPDKTTRNISLLSSPTPLPPPPPTLPPLHHHYAEQTILPQNLDKQHHHQHHHSLPDYSYSEPYHNSIYSPEIFQNNLAQHLGLSANDSFVLDSLAQGCAYEEYARIVNQEQQAKILATKKQRPKKYKCPHCNVGFSNNGQLKGHIRIHTGERPYKCDEKDCGKTFTRNEELTRHKRIHSGLRPFPCTHCGKRFGRKDHLKKHSRTHFQPKGVYAVPVMLPFETWVSGQAAAYPFVPVIY